MVRPLGRQVPALWIIVPTVIACAATGLATAYSSDFRVGLAVGIALSLCASFVVERRLKTIASTISDIAAGDRFAALPARGSGITKRIASATESIRNALVEAGPRRSRLPA